MDTWTALILLHRAIESLCCVLTIPPAYIASTRSVDSAVAVSARLFLHALPHDACAHAARTRGDAPGSCYDNHTGWRLVQRQVHGAGPLLRRDDLRLPEAKLRAGLHGGDAAQVGGGVQRDVYGERRWWREGLKSLRLPSTEDEPHLQHVWLLPG